MTRVKSSGLTALIIISNGALTLNGKCKVGTDIPLQLGPHRGTEYCGIKINIHIIYIQNTLKINRTEIGVLPRVRSGRGVTGM